MKKNLDFLCRIYIGFIGLMAFALIVWITPYGSGVSPDSTIYISIAKSLLSGKTYLAGEKLMSHYPPLYPFFLAVIGLFENNLIQAARFINAIMFGINVGLVGFAVYLTADHNFIATILATLVFLSSVPLVVLHSMAWSEPLFISLSLAGIIVLSKYVSRPSLTLLFISSSFLGLALITRYIGVALIPAALITVFFGGDGYQIGYRIRNAFILFFLACAPLGILLIRNLMKAGSATNRSLAFHPVSISHAKAFISSMYEFFSPIIIPGWTRALAIGFLSILLIVGLIIIFQRRFKEISWHSKGLVMPMSCFLYSASYILFLIISISFFDAYTPIDTRLLSPIFVFLIVGVFGVAWNLSKILKKPKVSLCFFFIVALSIAFKTPGAILSATDIEKNGQGYTSQLWQNSESMAFVKAIVEDVKIYSNGPDAIEFLSEKVIRSIPRKFSTSTMKRNYRYAQEIDDMCKDIRENRALLVYLNMIDWRPYLPTQEELDSIYQLPVFRRFADGTIYGQIHR